MGNLQLAKSSIRRALVASLATAAIGAGAVSQAPAQTSNTAYVSYRVVLPIGPFHVALVERGRSDESRSFDTPSFFGNGSQTCTGTWSYISRGRWYQIRARNLRTGETRYGSWFYVFDSTSSLNAPGFGW